MTLLDVEMGDYVLSIGFTHTWLRLGIMMMYDENKKFTLISRIGPAFLYIDR